MEWDKITKRANTNRCVSLMRLDCDCDWQRTALWSMEWNETKLPKQPDMKPCIDTKNVRIKPIWISSGFVLNELSHEFVVGTRQNKTWRPNEWLVSSVAGLWWYLTKQWLHVKWRNYIWILLATVEQDSISERTTKRRTERLWKFGHATHEHRVSWEESA